MKNFKQTKGEYKELHTPITQIQQLSRFCCIYSIYSFFLSSYFKENLVYLLQTISK